MPNVGPNLDRTVPGKRISARVLNQPPAGVEAVARTSYAPGTAQRTVKGVPLVSVPVQESYFARIVSGPDANNGYGWQAQYVDPATGTWTDLGSRHSDNGGSDPVYSIDGFLLYPGTRVKIVRDPFGRRWVAERPNALLPVKISNSITAAVWAAGTTVITSYGVGQGRFVLADGTLHPTIWNIFNRYPDGVAAPRFGHVQAEGGVLWLILDSCSEVPA